MIFCCRKAIHIAQPKTPQLSPVMSIIICRIKAMYLDYKFHVAAIVSSLVHLAGHLGDHLTGLEGDPTRLG